MEEHENDPDISLVEKEQLEFSYKNAWNIVFQRLRSEASLLAQYSSTAIAKSEQNRMRNRYRDVLPYDHTRIRLKDTPVNDYINASLIEVAKADDRRYIATQGPLNNTAGHFWLMVWQQESTAIIMLNRLMEKGVAKCYPYYPGGTKVGDVDVQVFPDVELRVTYVSEEDHGFYLCRTLILDNIKTSESREIRHFHYLTWPDFGVPASPGAFLNFLWAVRDSGALSREVGPPVIHCSAGIGRTGTFALVDASLVLIAKAGNMADLNLRDLLMSMRQHRMGLIQTHEQLAFSYKAVVEGGNMLLNTAPEDRGGIEFTMTPEDRLPPVPSISCSTPEDVTGEAGLIAQTLRYRSSQSAGSDFMRQSQEWQPGRIESTNEPLTGAVDNGDDQGSGEDGSVTSQRRRARHERLARTREQIDRIKTRMHEQDLTRHRWSWGMTLGLGGTALLVAATSILLYKLL